MIVKPPYGSPCNNCGLCCMDQICPLGQMVLGRGPDGPCPALLPARPGHKCGMVADPERFAPEVTGKHGVNAARNAAAHLVGAGYGCDALIEGETPDPDARRRMRLQSSAEKNADALAIWTTR